VIATKGRFQMGMEPNGAGNSRKHLMQAVAESLKNLQTDYIDLYQLHAWDSETPIEESLRTLNDLVRAGKIRYIGVSNFLGHHLQQALDYAKFMGLERIVSVQPQYHLLSRGIEFEIVPVSVKHNVGILPWSPLAGGILSGKYKRGTAVPEPGSRVEWATKIGWNATSWEFYSKNPATFNVLDALHDISAETKRSVAQISLRWLLQKPGVTSVIIGARTLQQLEDNLGATTFQLGADHMKRLNTVSAPPLTYPYDTMWPTQREIFGKAPWQIVPTVQKE